MMTPPACCAVRTSRTAALALLPGYSFTCHTFQPTCLVTLRRLRDLCALYHLRVTQLAVPPSKQELTLDPKSLHLSRIPTTVITLTFRPPMTDSSVEPSWAAFSAAASDCQDREPWRLSDPDSSALPAGEEVQRWLATWKGLPPLRAAGQCSAFLHQPLRRQARLPHTCRPPPLWSPLAGAQQPLRLPLQPGSLPFSLTFLQLGQQVDQPPALGVLPASLLYLALKYHHDTLQGSLPMSLERLRLWKWTHPLQAGVWPSGLKALHFEGHDRLLLPHVFPSSLLYLSFWRFDQPLLPSVLPSSLVELHLGDFYSHPLPPGALPSSLRRLSVCCSSSQPLQVGSLPEGPLFLCFVPRENIWAASLPP